jgi:hypothetical protein
MNKKQHLKMFLLVGCMFLVESCGPIVITSSLNSPPTWFYPNRVETVRYVYFPEHIIYYDLSLRNYLYLNKGVWVRVKTLPERYNGIKLSRSKFVRIKNYRDDNITRYHRENNLRSSTSRSRKKSN